MTVAKRVSVTSKPDLIPALRNTWRTTAAHKLAQLWRFLRISVAGFVMAVLEQAVSQLFNNDSIDITHLTQKVIVGALVGAVETVWRQRHPALTAAQVDQAPGATIVPAEVEAEGDAAP